MIKRLLIVFGMIFLTEIGCNTEVGAQESRIITQDHFDNLSGWTYYQNRPSSNFSVVIPGANTFLASDTMPGGAMKMDYKNDDNTLIEKTFPETTNFLARVYMYDDMAPNKEAFFSVIENIDTGVGYSIGIWTAFSSGYYAVRVRDASGYKNTLIKRSGGWHLFEIIVTDKGTYGKIDDTLINMDPALASEKVWEVYKDPLMTKASAIRIGAAHKVYGSALFDELTIVKQDERIWQDQFWERFKYFYNIYKDTDFSPIYNDGVKDNGEVRFLSGTGLYFYVYGKKFNDIEARRKGVELIKQVINKNQGLTWWVRGGSMMTLTEAGYLMDKELDQTTKDNLRKIIREQMKAVLETDPDVPKPRNGYLEDTKGEENGWDAAFLALAGNLYPDMPEAAGWEKKARCMGYHSITNGQENPNDPLNCGVKTQTVYENFRVDNHRQESPMYANGILMELANAAMAYKLAGKPVPAEYYHNAMQLYANYISKKIDWDTFYWTGVSSDWAGDWNSFGVYGLLVWDVAKEARVQGYWPADSVTASIVDSINDEMRRKFLSRSSLFFYQIPGHYERAPLKEPKMTAIAFRDSMASEAWYLNAIYAGEYMVAAALNYSPELRRVEATLTTTGELGDANGDKLVDLNDFAIWKKEYLGQLGTKTADFNRDGVVGLEDAAIWKSEYLE